MYNKHLLENGLRIVTNELPGINSVSIVFFIGAGSCYENEKESGISHFIEHLCFRGTKTRQTSKAISEVIESKGGVFNGGTDKEVTSIWCKVASQHFNIALDVLCDLIRNARFDSRDVDLERQIIFEEINMSLDSPQQRVDMLLDGLLWPNHPLGRDCAGNKDSIANLTREQIVNFYQKHYVPNNIVISIAGNIGSMDVYGLIEEKCASWVSEDVFSCMPQLTNNGVLSRVHIERRDLEQVNICLGLHGLSRSNHLRFAADIICMILGEGMSSRLFVELRDNQGLVYDIGSYVAHYAITGSFVIAAGVAPAKLSDAIVSIMRQLSKIKADISLSELERAKDMAKGRLLLALEDSRTIANWYGVQTILNNAILDIGEVVKRIESVKMADVNEVLEKYFVSDKLHLAIVGPVCEADKSFLDILKLS